MPPDSTVIDCVTTLTVKAPYDRVQGYTIAAVILGVALLLTILAVCIVFFANRNDAQDQLLRNLQYENNELKAKGTL